VCSSYLTSTLARARVVYLSFIRKSNFRDGTRIAKRWQVIAWGEPTEPWRGWRYPRCGIRIPLVSASHDGGNAAIVGGGKPNVQNPPTTWGCGSLAEARNPDPRLNHATAAMGKCLSRAVVELFWEFPVCFASCYSNVTGSWLPVSSGNPFANGKAGIFRFGIGLVFATGDTQRWGSRDPGVGRRSIRITLQALRQVLDLYLLLGLCSVLDVACF